ncbi:ACT domain-containing protein [Nocardioides currus]|uniref:Amino acid-binding protein n=1 Tax=Nocardioides currus TaxID=2133958 RepID=A0A2R7Z3L9_9ACTN|nr:ACT domain-containing protein [Nocardioides currus]PUA82919.1 amino acid-binding protein [Nocardioides currus]
MPFLLRVSLPDVPGSLGRVATAIGQAGGDIEAIEIVEKSGGGEAVDDVLLEMAPGAMPDSIVSACNALDGVEVLWISRYAAGGNLFLDLEVVEELTAHPAEALDRVLDLLPVTFRVDWAARVKPDGTVRRATDAAPSEVAWMALERPSRLPDDDVTLLCGAPLGKDSVVLGRRGGPEFLDSELARLGHLLGLARSISRA